MLSTPCEGTQEEKRSTTLLENTAAKECRWNKAQILVVTAVMILATLIGTTIFSETIDAPLHLTPNCSSPQCTNFQPCTSSKPSNDGTNNNNTKKFVIHKAQGSWQQSRDLSNTDSEQARWFTRFLECPFPNLFKCPIERKRGIFSWQWTDELQYPHGTTDTDGYERRHAHPRALSAFLDPRLDGITIGLAGDSLMRQVIVTLSCTYYALGAEITFNTTGDLWESVIRWNAKHAANQQIQHQQHFYQMRILRVASRYLLPRKHSSFREKLQFDFNSLDPLVKQLLRVDLNILVINVGLHHMSWLEAEYKDASYRSNLGNAFHLLDQALKPKNRHVEQRAPLHVIFQSTAYPHHNPSENCLNFTQPIPWAQRFPSSPGVIEGGKMNEAAQAVLLKHNLLTNTTFPIELLDVTDLSRDRPDAHVSRTDCLHFCEPGVVFEWNRYLMQLILCKL